jgi:hypothetical protein
MDECLGSDACSVERPLTSRVGPEVTTPGPPITIDRPYRDPDAVTTDASMAPRDRPGLEIPD